MKKTLFLLSMLLAALQAQARLPHLIKSSDTHCTGAPDVSIGLSNSETGVTSRLLNDTNNTGSPVSDNTGSTTTLGNQTAAGACTLLSTRTIGGLVIGGNIIYVKADATGANNGASWINAYNSLQSALDIAVSGDQIWVAAGTYKPSAHPAGCTGCSTDRDFTFLLKDGVSLYGGFAGTETALEERDIAANATILSGDIGTPNDASDNVHHVVLAAFADDTPTTRLDGFTITGGNASASAFITVNGQSIFRNRGGGIYTSGGTNTLTNNTLSGNSAEYGGGIYTSGGTNTLTNNTLSGNSASGAGGGIFISGGTNTLTNNILSENSAIGSSTSGGGIYTSGGTNTLTNNTLSGNSATTSGGGIYTDGGTNTLTNNTLSGNSAFFGGGIYTSGGTNTLTNNTLSGNLVVRTGGGIYTSGGTNTLTNNIFWENKRGAASNVAGADIENAAAPNASTLTVTYCLTQANSSFSSGTGIINNQDPLFTDAAAGDFTLQACSPAINAGNGSAWTATGLTTDAAGNARPVGVVDMGALEFQGTVPAAGNANTLYVNATNTTPGNGRSWACAFNNLQNALNAAVSGDQIWVAAGTYKPSAYPSGCTGCSTNRDFTFLLKDGVSLYGGFAGTETALEERDIAANATILSGDIGTPNDASDNVHHVVLAAFADDTPTTRLDGFTITGGNASASAFITVNGQNIFRRFGGGIFMRNGTNTLTNNILSGNTANGSQSAGGGIYTSDGTNTLTNNTLSENSAGNLGGGIYTERGTNTLTNNTLSGNTAQYDGGGIFTERGTNTLTNNTLSGNSAGNLGGGIYTERSTNTLTNNILSGNSASVRGGGIFTERGTNTLTNNTLSGNSASGAGGGIFTDGGTNTLTNNTLSGNTAQYEGGGIFTDGGTNTLTNNTLSGNSAEYGGGIFTDGGTNTLTNNIFWNNEKDGASNVAGADIENSGSALTVTYCLTQANSSFSSGTGIINNQDPLFTDAAAGDFTLQVGSPAINSGSDAAWTATGLSTDAAGNPRPVGVVDMGAFEYRAPDYTITTTGNAIVVTDVAGNGETVEVTENGAGIRFNAAGRTFSLNGGATIAFPADVPLAGANAITVNAGAGDDEVAVNITTNAIPDLTINGGAGNLVFSGSLTNNAAEARNLTLTSDGHITLSQQSTSGMPLNVAATAAGNITVGSVGFRTNGGSFSGSGVDITVTSNGLNTARTGEVGGSVTLALTGNLLIDQDGVRTGGGAFSATGGVDVTIRDTGVNTTITGGSATVTIACTGNVLVDVFGKILADGNVSITADALEIKAPINTTAGTVAIHAPNGTSPKHTDPEVTATSLSFASGSKLLIAINGVTTPNTDYDQLGVIGTVNLTGVTLALSGTHTPAIGETFTIVDNDGVDAITSTFSGLAEGGRIIGFLGSGFDATITYTGGDGNDVVLTVVEAISTAITGTIVWEHDLSTPVPEATVAMTGDDMGSDNTDTNGDYAIPTAGGDLILTPTRQLNPREGVTVADALRIQQHVVNLAPFNDPYKMIAADVNQTNSVTSIDVSIIQQALLNNPTAGAIFDTPAWRFVDATHVFPNPKAPWGFPASIGLEAVTADVTDVDFIGVKIGDVNGTWATPPAFMAPPLVWQAPDYELETGSTIRIPFVFGENLPDVAAWQFALRFDPAQMAFGQVIPRTAVPLTREEFGASRAPDGELRSVFVTAQGLSVKAGEVAFEIEFYVSRGGMRLSQALYLDDNALEGRAYDTHMKAGPVRLAFRPVTDLVGVKPAIAAANALFDLYQNEPNPVFAGATANIRFHLPEAGSAVLTVRDLLGRVVHQQADSYTEGQHLLRWETGNLASTTGGVLTYTLQFEGISGATYTATRKMVVLR